MTTTIPADGTHTYLPDRYERLTNGAEIIASDPNVAQASSIFGAEGLRAFTKSLVDARILDGLTEHDADTVAMLVILNFIKGPKRMAWRLQDWLKENNSVGRTDDNTWAVCAVLGSIQDCRGRLRR